MVGGSAEGFRLARPLLESFAKKIFHVGPCGSGSRMKLVVNLAIGLNRAVLAEALSFARKQNLDAGQVLETLKAGPSYSAAMDVKGEKMLRQQFEPQARLSQHLKDVRLILAQGRKVGARVPLSELHRKLLERAEELGYGPSDNSAVIKAYD